MLVDAFPRGSNQLRGSHDLGFVGDAHTMHAVVTAAKRGFETAITIRTHADVAVVALDRAGRVLARSRTVRLR